MNKLINWVYLLFNEKKIARRHWKRGMEFEGIKYNRQKQERACELEFIMELEEKKYPKLRFIEHSPYNSKYMWTK